MAAALLGGLIRGFVGFGGALVIILVASATLGPLMALPVAALSGLPATAQLLPSAFRHAEAGFVLPFGGTSFVSAPLGTLVLVSVEPAIMKVAISVFVLAMVYLLARGWQPRFRLDALTLSAAGAVTGLIQGAAGVGGPPSVATALARGGTPERQRGNVIGVVTALALCALAPLFWHGLVTKAVVVISLMVVPVYSGATWLGAQLFDESKQRYFRAAALATLAVTGIVTFSLSVLSLAGLTGG